MTFFFNLFPMSTLLTSNTPSAALGKPLIGVVMGSSSDWDTMKHACRFSYILAWPMKRA